VLLQKPFVLGNNDNEQGYYAIPAYGRGINVTKAQGDDFLLAAFTCPNHQQALARRAAGVPVWQYRYFGDWENVRLYPTSGAYHGTELQMVLGNSEAVSGRPKGVSETKTQSLMQRLWADFARDPVRGLENAGWPHFDPDAESLALLAHRGSPAMELIEPGIYAASCT
jgi:cholinesterase